MNTELSERLKKAEQEISGLKAALAKRDEYIRTTFGRYLTDEVLEEILRGDKKTAIGGERRKVSMLFSDLRNSTGLSEEMDPACFIRMLNHYLEDMIEIINSWQGNILEFVGDAIVVVFGAPRENEEAARDAAACAVAMQRRMKAVNEWNREQGYPEISMGIGIHTGEAILGNIGSSVRTKYDMIGRNVNLASRIEGYSKGGQILISEQERDEAGSQLVINEQGTMTVRPKGIQSDIRIYDVIGFGSHRLT
ncbi:MAG: adenylate/guanylate cyclase domain-containing protein [Oscillospiraceae bacterium]|nr:adenylate/guanylate cyclase domain-containing protein [Oscillospiraceae bacterium]